MDVVYRSEAEVSRGEVQQAQAKNAAAASKAYFNFLLNKPLDEEIELMREDPEPLVINLDEARDRALASREELKQFQQYRHLNSSVVKMHRGKNIPGLFGAVDYGFQGEEYRFTGDDDFLLASIVFRWNLFQGTANIQKVKQSQIEGKKLDEAYSEAEHKIQLEVINNYYSLVAAYEAIQSARKQEQSASRAYRLIYRKYMEGQASLLELIDARTSMTGAATNFIVAQSEYFIRKADFEYAAGTIDVLAY